MNICFTPIKNSLLVLFLFAVLSGTHTAYAAAPTISSISPLSGTTTTEVTITGTGFAANAKDNIILFGTIAVYPANDINHSTTRMTVFPPAGFANERITVLANGLSVTSNQYFLLTSTFNCAITQYSFDPKVDIPTGSVPISIASGDIDKDGYDNNGKIINDGTVDLVVANLLDASVTIYQNSIINRGTFSTRTINVGTNPTSVLLADIDGDQKLDLILGHNNYAYITILLNTTTSGTISFAAPVTSLLTGGITGEKLAIADLDSDGKPDIIAINSMNTSIGLIRNTSTVGLLQFDAPYNVPIFGMPHSLTTGDLNGDNKPEIILTTLGANIKILLNKGSLGGFNVNSFEPSNTFGVNGVLSKDVELADINTDGLLDIIVGSTSSTQKAVTVFKNTFIPGTVGNPPAVSFATGVNYTTPNTVTDLSVADFNGDGRPDVIASIQGAFSMAIYLNTTPTGGTIDANSFATPVSFDIGGSPFLINVSDFNSDEKADIAVIDNNSMSPKLSIFKRVADQKTSGYIGLNGHKERATTCPSTEVPLNLWLSGKSPWTIIYEVIPDSGPSFTETLTNITSINNEYNFNVSSEKTLTYTLKSLRDAQECATFDLGLNSSNRPSAYLIIIPTPSIKPTTIPNGALNTPYNQTFTLDDPTVSPLSWNVSSGVPTGLTFSNHAISGTPTEHNTFTFTVTANFSACSPKRQYNVLFSNTSTTWNGTRWSNGVPDNINGLDAIIDGNYNTAVNGPITCFHLAVNEGDTLFIKGNNDVTAAGNAINNGMIYRDCSRQLAITGTFAGAAVKIVQPQILPAFLPNGLINLAYNQPLQVSIGESPTYTLLKSLPPGLSLTNGVIQGTPTTLGSYNFSVKSTEYTGLCEASGNFTIIVETVDPNLQFASNGITKITGTAPFSYLPTTKSSGTITYSISPTGPDACASIDASGKINITCGGPIKQYTITAIQETKSIYKADTATTILTVEKMKPELHLLKTGYILGSTTGNTVQYTTNPPNSTVSVFQINNSNIATVNMLGAVTPLAAGTFDILLKIAETPMALAFDTLVTMSVHSSFVPPVAAAINVVLEMGKDSTINLLATAQGITGAINASLTDIDTENAGVQYRFYSTELGNFLLDNNGNLSIRPFSGFIGQAKVGYVLTDENGTTSDVYYITVVVNPPYVIPDLKANNTITPNNDGLNDNFVIAFTDITKENSLTIIDESGSTIYTASNYQNDWSGKTNKGDQLEPGVYFYAFNELYSGRKLNGYIQIIK